MQQIDGLPPGLKGVVVADTELGSVRGDEGFYHFRQYSAPDLARSRTLEDVWALVIDGALPSGAEGARFARELAEFRMPGAGVRAALPAIAEASATTTAALRTAVSLHAAELGLRPLLDLAPAERRRDALALAAVVPALAAAVHRLRDGKEPIDPDPDRPVAADYLRMVNGVLPEWPMARAVEQYLILTVDHGFNASAFCGRIVASTGSDLGSVVVAGMGALFGPLHGGAPSRALDTIQAIGSAGRAAAWTREELTAGRRIMGFGHAVYRTDDPRSVLLREIARSLGGELVEVAIEAEAEIERTLATERPGRALKANVEWYASVVMSRCGLPPALFTPTFAISRTVGWCAHALEQAASGTLIRPSSRYVGPSAPQPVPPT